MLFQTRTFGDGNGPTLLIVAGVHGDEYEPMFALRRLLARLEQLPVRGRVTVIPIVNEHAFLRGQRTAEDERDLARTMPGRADGSLTERVAAELTSFIQQADFLIDLHTGGRLFAIMPLAGYVLHPRDDVLHQQRAMARAFGLPIVWGTYPFLNGRTLSVARDWNVPAIYVEACGGGMFQPSAVQACERGCLGVASSLGLIPTQTPVPDVEIIVEDPRDQSGFMQMQHPAPVDGVFEPLRPLGYECRVNDVIGRVSDACGNVLAEITASEWGLLLFQRAVPGVKAGESTGGILPLAYRVEP